MLPGEVFSLEHGVNCRGLGTQTSAITEVAKYPLHLGGVKQLLKEDLLNSSMPWLGLETVPLRQQSDALTTRPRHLVFHHGMA